MYLFELVFVSCGYVSGSGIAKSYGNSVFHFLRNLHTILHQFVFLAAVGFLKNHFLFTNVAQTPRIALSMEYMLNYFLNE